MHNNQNKNVIQGDKQDLQNSDFILCNELRNTGEYYNTSNYKYLLRIWQRLKYVNIIPCSENAAYGP